MAAFTAHKKKWTCIKVAGRLVAVAWSESLYTLDGKAMRVYIAFN